MITVAKSFRQMFEEAEKSLAYWVEGAILEFTEAMVARMEQMGVSNAELARRLGVKPSYVTKLLGGSNNFTLETMVKVARALDAEVGVSLRPVAKAAGRASETVKAPLRYTSAAPLLRRVAERSARRSKQRRG